MPKSAILAIQKLCALLITEYSFSCISSAANELLVYSYATICFQRVAFATRLFCETAISLGSSGALFSSRGCTPSISSPIRKQCKLSSTSKAKSWSQFVVRKWADKSFKFSCKLHYVRFCIAPAMRSNSSKKIVNAILIPSTWQKVLVSTILFVNTRTLQLF